MSLKRCNHDPLHYFCVCEQVLPFLIFCKDKTEAPLLGRAMPIGGMESLGEESMVGVPLGE